MRRRAPPRASYPRCACCAWRVCSAWSRAQRACASCSARCTGERAHVLQGCACGHALTHALCCSALLNVRVLLNVRTLICAASGRCHSRTRALLQVCAHATVCIWAWCQPAVWWTNGHDSASVNLSCMHTHSHTHTRAHTRAHTHAHTHTHTHAHTHARAHVHVGPCLPP